jgi:hypothetical protein
VAVLRAPYANPVDALGSLLALWIAKATADVATCKLTFGEQSYVKLMLAAFAAGTFVVVTVTLTPVCVELVAKAVGIMQKVIARIPVARIIFFIFSSFTRILS